MMKMSEQEFIEISEMIHEWRDVVGYEGLYRVSEYGDIMSLSYKQTGEKRLLKPRKNKDGYMFVRLSKNGKVKAFFVHRLVATAFCEGGDYFQQVNHIDEDTTNNHYLNLEWCSPEYNVNYGTRNKRASESNKVKVKCIELNMVFNSVSEASEYMNTSISNISACVSGKRKTTRGYHWEYVD